MMMDGFNPLDLLASAAELQQKHEDGPERIIIQSKQKKYNTTKIYVGSNGQKENRELSSAGNITKNKPSVVIVKKVKKSDINSDLEKMLDEHNYGNAKRINSKMENLDPVTETSAEKRRISLLSDNGKTAEEIVSDGQCSGKIQNLRSSSTSAICDTEKGSNSNIVSSDKSSCFNCTCAKYQGKLDEKSLECDIHQNKEIIFQNNQQTFNCIKLVDGSKSTSSRNLIINCNEEQQNCDTFITNSEQFTLNDDGILLNEQTGELIYKKLPESTMKQSPIICDPEPDELKHAAAGSVENLNKPVLGDQVPSLTDASMEEIKSESKLVDFTTLGPSKPLSNLTDIKTLDVGNVKTLLAQKQISLQKSNNAENKKPPQLNITQTCPDAKVCNVSALDKKSVSIKSLKNLEIGNTLCGDDASTSVHLLSPDGRNPDSVGIVVSPKSLYENEFSLHNQDCTQDLFRKGEKEKTLIQSVTEIDELKKGSLQSVEEMPFDISHCHSTSRSDISSPSNDDTSSVETVTDCRELNVESRLLVTDKTDNCKNSANNILSPLRENSIFCLDSDHCYAGVQGKVNTSGDCKDSGTLMQNESEEVKTPLGSLSEWSQDSGYEDVTQSPEVHQQQQTMLNIVENTENPPALKSLVPVLVSLNKNGSLTVHDNNLTRTLGGSVFFHENMKLITGTNSASSSKVPLISHVGKVASPLNEAFKNVKSASENVIGVISPKKKDLSETIPPENSPPKYGKFRIGTFASFSNTGTCMEPPTCLSSVEGQDEDNFDSTSHITKKSNSGKCSPTVNSLGSLVQKVKSSLSPTSHNVLSVVNHIQHDHDYCTKNLMPSVVNSFLETRLLSKDNGKGKVAHTKGKKSDLEFRTDGKSFKRKRNSSNVSKEETSEDFDIDSESDTLSFHSSLRQKYRSEKNIESKRTDPKVKITGSSNFQDQFVYFMNTKKRSRRRESKDIPIPNATDRVFIPPKPGDIVVPHLTDQDIENLKLRSKHGKNTSGTQCSNYLRNEFMAAKLSNGVFSSTQPLETVDDEKTIINTILSLENEDLVSPNQGVSEPYNESMEIYGQGLNADIMNLLPEQMNLTPEQIDMLYSAVDEVQNSSSDLVDTDKLVSRDTSECAGHLQSDTYNESSVACSTTSSDCEGKADREQLSTNISKDPDISNEPENDGKDASCTTDSKEFTDSGRNFQTGEMNNIEQITQRYSNTETSPGAANESSDDHATNSKHDFDMLSLNSKSTNTLQNLHQPFGKEDGVSSMMATTSVSSVKPLLPTATLDSTRNSAFESDVTSVTSSSLTSEISIPHIDKSLYLLGNDFDKGDIFQDGSVAPPAQVDYNAPWIVTVSMYWNDLPAIMINNQPFVRLVDIHKQILPAKDTGILKKRCQLMNIEVDNCSEMQRYFLVQYGKAFNSKSTLIISKDDAKILIGYYVDPQPKTLRPEDRKSIVDHRREQLRRIAIARRSAIRAQRLGKKSDSDPREIKQSKDDVDGNLPINCSLQEQSEKITNLPSSSLSNKLTVADEYSRQRATRHKKINFLEMLRGDTSNLGEVPTNEHAVKHKAQNSEAKKKKKMKEKKVKVAKCTIETDSSEETDSVLSDYISENPDIDSMCASDVKILKRPVEQKLSPIFLTKVKHRVKRISKPFRKRNLKRGLKLSKPSLKSTPLAIQVVNKSVSKLNKSVYKHTVTLGSKRELPKKQTSQFFSKNILLPEKMDIVDSKNTDQTKKLDCVMTDSASSSNSKQEIIQKSVNEVTNNIEPSISLAETDESLVSKDMPVKEMNNSLHLKPFESVTIQTDSDGFENNKTFSSTEKFDVNQQNMESENEDNSIIRNWRKSDIEEKSQSSGLDNSSVSVMKRKSNIQIRSDETPVRVTHREVSPQTQKRTRSQLGELFVEHYHNKRSLCVRCYTCRKLMSVDNFLHHLHDVSGGLLPVMLPQTIDLCDQNQSENENKQWEIFLRKKEMFDNNQLPSDSRDIDRDNLDYGMDRKSSDNSKQSIDGENCQSGPRIITTPVSPSKKDKIFHKQNSGEKKKSQLVSNQVSFNVTGSPKQKKISNDLNVRTSSRKRKLKHLYGFENYSFTKFPRLMKNAVVKDGEK